MKLHINKRFFLVLIILTSLLFLIQSIIVFAGNTHDIAYDCPDGCVKDKTINYLANITNLGEDYTYILYLSVKDSITLETIAEFGKKVTADTSEMTKISPGSTHSFELQGILPPPNLGSDLIYQLCTIQRVPYEIWTAIGNIEYCYKINYTIPMLDCISSSDCDDNGYCLDNQCILLNCTECQYIEEHKCVDYDCCSNNDCSLNEVCSDHNCELLDCDSSDIINQTKTDNQTQINESLKQYAVNHTCSTEPCLDDEIIVDYACVKPSCGEDEFLSEYECKKLDCSSNQIFFNHTCIISNCKENEAVIDNKCAPLSCADDEAIINNVCTKLNCKLFQRAEDHSCPINTLMFIESVFLALIIFLLVLDIKKYNGKHRKKIVSMLLKKAKERGTLKSPKKEMKPYRRIINR